MNKVYNYGFLFFFMALTIQLSAIEISVSTVKYMKESNPYVEIYSRVSSGSVQWVADTSQNVISSNLEYLVLISQNGQMVLAEKYNLSSPLSNEQVDYWDLKRFGLEQGKYDIELQYVDLNNPVDTFSFNQSINVRFEAGELAHSDVLFLSEVDNLDGQLPFNKASFKFEPLAYNLINPDQKQLIFYAELYNTVQAFDDTYFIKYFVENTDKTGLEAFSKTGYKKLEPNSFESLLIDFDIAGLKSGNYILHLELNRKNRTLVKEFSSRFSIYNPFEDYKQNFKGDAAFETSFVQAMDEDELNYSLKAIFPRIGNNMTELLNQIIANSELMPKKYFLYNFWSSFSQDNYRSLYEKYMEVARAVDLTYANNVGRGFETHRGYYFLKYGKPDDIIFVEDEPTAPPYEIWIYNYLEETQQTNVRFLFYNPSLATNDFIILHSTCRGERYNPRWELELYSAAYNDQPSNFIDSSNMPDGFHRNARKIFDDY